ncbi:hypothetical protein [Modicisalibacter xianhensis]|uniref:hypothetical protein n=1 Tax=Modicisalibacter xianhensis TaxID=442341 RepID=UPI001063E68E|nr:hypothetical protein [Halomonas xianhensis]
MLIILNVSADKLKDMVAANRELENLALKDNLINACRDEMIDDLVEIKDIASRINFNQPDPQDGFDIISYMQSVLSTAYLLDSYLVSSAAASNIQSNMVATLSTWVKNTLIPWVQNMWKTVWPILSKLTTPQEWKVRGSIGNTSFGLGNADIEIKFG